MAKLPPELEPYERSIENIIACAAIAAIFMLCIVVARVVYDAAQIAEGMQ